MKTILHTESGKLLGITNIELVHKDITLIEFNKDEHKKLKYKTSINESDFPKLAKQKVNGYTIFNYIWDLSEYCGKFQSVDIKGEKASKSEIKRWFERNCIEINHFICNDVDELMDFKVYSLVLFPNNAKKRCTMV